MTLPPRQGLYDPELEHDACGLNFVADLHGRPSHKIIEHGLGALCALEHRGAAGSDPEAVSYTHLTLPTTPYV